MPKGGRSLPYCNRMSYFQVLAPLRPRRLPRVLAVLIALLLLFFETNYICHIDTECFGLTHDANNGGFWRLKRGELMDGRLFSTVKGSVYVYVYVHQCPTDCGARVCGGGREVTMCIYIYLYIYFLLIYMCMCIYIYIYIYI